MNRMNGTRFLTQDELAKTLTEIDINAKTYPVGGIPMLVQGDKLYIDATDSHTMIFGATGSKKTRMFAMPSIGIFARAGESFVVTDPKGELYDRTMGDVVSFGYESNCLNLRDFRAGVTWNPLALPYRYYHNGKRAKAIEFAMEMSKMVIGMNSTEEVFWTNTAIDVFSGFMLLLFEKAEEEECHFRGLFELWKGYINDRKAVLKKIKEEFGKSIIYQKISSLDNPSDKTVGSIEAFISMGLNKLGINEDFIDFLSQKGLDLQEIAGKKNAIYLVIPDENTSYHFVASLFLEQLYEVLIEKAQNEVSHMLPVRMNFLIDEFANIPKIGNMDAMITAARSRNIRFQLIVQGKKQLEQKYAEGADTIMGNCNNWVYLYSKEYDLLQEISRLCGEVVYDNNVRMPLFSEFDLQHLRKEKGEALVLSGRSYPCLTNLADINEYPYPILSTKEMVKPQLWKQVSCFSWEKDHSKNYFCETIDDNFRFFEETKEADDSRQWLVAVGPDGMIMEEGIYKKHLIENKAAIGAMACGKLERNELEPELLEWYYTKTSVRNRYSLLLKNFPQKVYVTLADLGAEKFTKVEERTEKVNRIDTTRDCKVELFFTDDVQREPNRQFSLGTVKAYRQNVGTIYMIKCAFRKANEALEGTEFEQAEWRFLGKNKTKDYVESRQFVKRGASGELVILEVTDYRNAIKKRW